MPSYRKKSYDQSCEIFLGRKSERKKNQEGISVLLQFNTSKDQNFANMRPFG